MGITVFQFYLYVKINFIFSFDIQLLFLSVTNPESDATGTNFITSLEALTDIHRLSLILLFTLPSAVPIHKAHVLWCFICHWISPFLDLIF